MAMPGALDTAWQPNAPSRADSPAENDRPTRWREAARERRQRGSDERRDLQQGCEKQRKDLGESSIHNYVLGWVCKVKAVAILFGCHHDGGRQAKNVEMVE